MAFCNSCGATLTPGTKFCNKCGAAIAGSTDASTTSSAATPAPPPSSGYTPTRTGSTGGNNALKTILIVLAVIVVLGIFGLLALGVIARHYIAKNVHVSQHGDHVRVETPFGSTETSKDPAQVVHDLGVDVYPGAQVENNGATTATFGGIHTVAASFSSSDTVDKVCAFYKSKFPNPMATTSSTDRCTIVSNDQKNMITINIEAKGDSTKFQITNVTKASSSSN
jgi:hypothetical protein